MAGGVSSYKEGYLGFCRAWNGCPRRCRGAVIGNGEIRRGISYGRRTLWSRPSRTRQGSREGVKGGSWGRTAAQVRQPSTPCSQALGGGHHRSGWLQPVRCYGNWADRRGRRLPLQQGQVVDGIEDEVVLLVRAGVPGNDLGAAADHHLSHVAFYQHVPVSIGHRRRVVIGLVPDQGQRTDPAGLIVVYQPWPIETVLGSGQLQ